MKNLVLWLKTSAFLLVFFSTPHSVGAENKQVNYFWQAPSEQFVLTPSVASRIFLIEAPAFETEIFSDRVSLQADYGISEKFSIGMEIPYVATKTESEFNAFGNQKTSNRRSGFSDWLLNFQGRENLDKINLRYGATLSLSLENSKSDSSGSTNEYSGGNSITPYLGIDMNLGGFVLGAKISQEILLGDYTSEFEGVETKSSGSEITSLTVFGEFNHGDHQFGGFLSYIAVADSKSPDSTLSENFNFAQLSVYANLALATNIELVPQLSYFLVTNKDINGSSFESVDIYELRLPLRIYF